MDKDVFSFIIYMIHSCSNRWNKTPAEVYRLLTSVDCINKYLVPHFDILHTQSTAYIVDDIKEYLNVRGINI